MERTIRRVPTTCRSSPTRLDTTRVRSSRSWCGSRAHAPVGPIPDRRVTTGRTNPQNKRLRTRVVLRRARWSAGARFGDLANERILGRLAAKRKIRAVRLGEVGTLEGFADTALIDEDLRQVGVGRFF